MKNIASNMYTVYSHVSLSTKNYDIDKIDIDQSICYQKNIRRKVTMNFFLFTY